VPTWIQVVVVYSLLWNIFYFI